MDIIKDYGRLPRYDINPQANDKEAMIGTAMVLLGGLLLGQAGLHAALKKGPEVASKLEKFVSNLTDSMAAKKIGLPPGAAEYIKYEKETKDAAGDPQAWEAIKELLRDPGTTALAKLHNVYKAYGSAGLERIIKEYERVMVNKGNEPAKSEKKPAAPRKRTAPKTTATPEIVVPEAVTSIPPAASESVGSADEIYGREGKDKYNGIYKQNIG